MSEEQENQQASQEAVEKPSLNADMFKGLMQTMGMEKPKEEEKKPEPEEAVKLESDKPEESPKEEPKPESQEKPKEEETKPKEESPKEEEPKEEEKPFKISAKDILVKKKDKPQERPQEDPFTEQKQDLKKTDEEAQKKSEEEPKKESINLEGLDSKQQGYVNLVQFGEENNHVEKGKAKELANYFSKRNDLRNRLIEENADDDEYNPEKDPKFRRWHKDNKPPIEPERFETLREERLVHRAREEAQKGVEERYKSVEEQNKKLQRELERSKLLPKIEREVEQFSNNLLQRFPQEVQEVLKKESDPQKIEEQIPLEYPIVQKVLGDYKDAAQSFIEFRDGLRDMTPKDRGLLKVRDLISKQEAVRLRNPEKFMRGGKQFVPISTPSEKFDPQRHWTFTDKDILQMLQVTAGKEAESAIDAEKQRLKRLARYVSPPTQEQKVQSSGEEESAGGSASVKTRPAQGGGDSKKNSDADIFRKVLGL